MTQCYFTPSKQNTSATICANCGQEKSVHTIGEGINVIKIEYINTPTMKEELKQAIEEAVKLISKQSTAPDKETPYWMETDIRNGIAAALSSPSILRHADPEVMDKAGWMPKPTTSKEVSEIMKQSGWVREEEVKHIINAVLSIEPLNTGDFANGACCPFCKEDCSKWNDQDLSNTQHLESCAYLIAKTITKST